MKKFFATLLVVAMMAAILAGCGAPAADAGSDEVVIGLAMNTLANPFFVTVKEGVEAAAAAHGYKVITTDAQDDPAIQQ